MSLMQSPAKAPSQRMPPKVRNPGGIYLGLFGDPLTHLTRLAATPDDVVMFRNLGERFYLIKTPALVHEVLVSKGRNFTKGRSLERLRKVVGNGLLTNEGDSYLRQRRLIQPLFHGRSIRNFADAIVEQTMAFSQSWREGETRDLAQEMMALTLGVVSRTILGSSEHPQAAKVSETMETFMKTFPLLMVPFAEVLEQLPIPAIKRLRKVREELDQMVYELIAARRRQPSSQGDLLSMLLAAQDPEAKPGDDAMTDEQVHDEVLIMFLAGHETTGAGLSWIWFLLGEHPEVEAKVHAELERLLPDRRRPTAEDFPKLTYTRQVVNEAFRLYPPVPTVARRAIDDCDLGGYHVPARTIVLMSQWLMHRDPKLFHDPLQFLPERWTPEYESSLPKVSYFPFGGGLRRCIGEGFALMEIVLVLATIAPRWRFQVDEPRKVVPRPLFTLRMKEGLRVTLQERR